MYFKTINQYYLWNAKERYRVPYASSGKCWRKCVEKMANMWIEFKLMQELALESVPLQHHAAGRHVVLCGGGHCAFGSDPHVPHCGKARPDRIHPALLFPEQPTPAVQLGQSGSGDAVGVRHGLSRGERAGRRVAGLAVRAL